MNGFERRIGYDKTASETIAAGTGKTLITEVIPVGLVLMLTHFANYVSDVMAWGQVVWTVKINGNPWQGFDAVKDQLGDPANPRELGNPPIARGGDVVTITATNNSGVAYAAGVSVKGAFGFFREGA